MEEAAKKKLRRRSLRTMRRSSTQFGAQNFSFVEPPNLDAENHGVPAATGDATFDFGSAWVGDENACPHAFSPSTSTKLHESQNVFSIWRDECGRDENGYKDIMVSPLRERQQNFESVEGPRHCAGTEDKLESRSTTTSLTSMIEDVQLSADISSSSLPGIDLDQYGSVGAWLHVGNPQGHQIVGGSCTFPDANTDLNEFLYNGLIGSEQDNSNCFISPPGPGSVVNDGFHGDEALANASEGVRSTDQCSTRPESKGESCEVVGGASDLDQSLSAEDFDKSGYPCDNARTNMLGGDSLHGPKVRKIDVSNTSASKYHNKKTDSLCSSPSPVCSQESILSQPESSIHKKSSVLGMTMAEAIQAITSHLENQFCLTTPKATSKPKAATCVQQDNEPQSNFVQPKTVAVDIASASEGDRAESSLHPIRAKSSVNENVPAQVVLYSASLSDTLASPTRESDEAVCSVLASQTKSDSALLTADVTQIKKRKGGRKRLSLNKSLGADASDVHTNGPKTAVCEADSGVVRDTPDNNATLCDKTASVKNISGPGSTNHNMDSDLGLCRITDDSGSKRIIAENTEYKSQDDTPVGLKENAIQDLHQDLNSINDEDPQPAIEVVTDQSKSFAEAAQSFPDGDKELLDDLRHLDIDQLSCKLAELDRELDQSFAKQKRSSRRRSSQYFSQVDTSVLEPIDDSQTNDVNDHIGVIPPRNSRTRRRSARCSAQVNMSDYEPVECVDTSYLTQVNTSLLEPVKDSQVNDVNLKMNEIPESNVAASFEHSQSLNNFEDLALPTRSEEQIDMLRREFLPAILDDPLDITETMFSPPQEDVDVLAACTSIASTRRSRRRKSWSVVQSQTGQDDGDDTQKLSSKSKGRGRPRKQQEKTTDEEMVEVVEQDDAQSLGYKVSPAVERLYQNKPYIAPPSHRYWETVREHPSRDSLTFTKQRHLRFLTFEEGLTHPRMVKRHKKAMSVLKKVETKPVKMSDEEFRLKLAAVDSMMSELTH